MYLSTAVAFSLDVVAKLISAASYVIMKLAHHKLEGKQKEGISNTKVYCSATWIIGLICVIAGSALHVITLPFCGLVLLSTTVGLSVVFSNILAMRFLGEKLVWKYDLAAFLLVVGGCTAIVFISVNDDQKLTSKLVVELLFST